jgi:hypothetical protein
VNGYNNLNPEYPVSCQKIIFKSANVLQKNVKGWKSNVCICALSATSQKSFAENCV